MDEQLKLAHKVVDLANIAITKFCVTLPRYNVDKPASPLDQILLLERKKEDRKFQRIFFKKFKFEEIVYLLLLMISVSDKVITKKSFCNFP